MQKKKEEFRGTIDITFFSVIFAELMVLGFISLTLTFSQNYIVGICIPLRYANTMLP
jgi:F0F1-type ATP synthase assembly protein I